MADAPPATAADREERKKAEKEAKAVKAAEKAARQAQRAASQTQKGAEVLGPSVTLLDWEGHDYGNLFIQSHAAPARAWTEVPALEPSLKGREVWVRARVATSRKQGKTLCFAAGSKVTPWQRPSSALFLLRVRLVAPCNPALPGRGPATGRPPAASGARASRLQSRRFHCV